MQPVPYDPPNRDARVDVSLGDAQTLQAKDLERIALASIAHEVARRAVHARVRDDGHADSERADSLELAANILRDVCGLPEFDFGVAREAKEDGK